MLGVTDVLRPRCLDLAPEWIESLARSCPVSPGGVHQFLASFVARSYHYLSAEEQVKILYWATADCGRPMQANEIESTVTNVRRWRGDRDKGLGHAESPWEQPVPEVIDEIASGGINVKALRQRSPWKLQTIEEPPSVWLPRLFRWGSILCLGHEVLYPAALNGGFSVRRVWRTRRLSSWTGRYRSDCDNASLLVPNPAIYTWGYTKDGRPSTRCAEMFPVREFYLAVEFDFAPLSRDDTRKTNWTPYIEKWAKQGLSVKDVCAALLWHLQQYVPLVLAVWSGKKSLQGWYNIQGLPEEQQRRFLNYACGLGADHVTWVTCQLIRMPGAVRPENKARQTVEYFDPSHLPRF